MFFEFTAEMLDGDPPAHLAVFFRYEELSQSILYQDHIGQLVKLPRREHLVPLFLDLQFVLECADGIPPDTVVYRFHLFCKPIRHRQHPGVLGSAEVRDEILLYCGFELRF